MCRIAPFALVAALAASSCGLFGPSTPDPAEGFRVVDGLEVTLWAAEPDVVNPTNMAIDERGRIWITEAINYRRKLKNVEDITDQGDRIIILEDTDGDGVSDSRKVFDQSMELRSPLGIAVFGDKVYVSQSPDVWVYTKDSQDNIVSKEKLLTGFGGFDHDHGVHAFNFGHDGRLWFNAGDQGFDITTQDGRRLTSSHDGPFYAGTILSMNEDGSDLQVYAHNFRNPYEMTMDSYGSVWQTDNDDDGNQWTRLNYVMEGGNYGYWGPGGKRWREDHGSHFHHELPGVVPDIARTGPGSPTGVTVYEGDLLPEKYHGQLIHSEPGKRHIYGFLLSPSGAGYSMEDVELVSTDDRQFRPSDVAVGPDGAVYFSDWYDNVVGGHDMKDWEKGRIYRLAPPDHLPAPVRLDLESPEGLAAGLASPNPSTHYLAYRELESQGQAAVPTLLSIYENGSNIAKARALWLLAKTGAEGAGPVEAARKSSDAREKILGFRVSVAAGGDILSLVDPLLSDPDPQVRREAAVSLQHVDGEAAVEPLVTLAKQYDGRDRWYLEAWAIGARGKEKSLAARLGEEFSGDFDPKYADFLWQLEADRALPYLSRAARRSSLSVDDRLRALRAIGDRGERAAARTVAGLAADSTPEIASAAFEKLSRQLFSRWIGHRKDPVVVAAVRRALADEQLQATALGLAESLGDATYGVQLAGIVRDAQAPVEHRSRALTALGATRDARYLPILSAAAAQGPIEFRAAAVRALGLAQPPDLSARMEELLAASDAPNEVGAEAIKLLGRDVEGLNRILDLEQAGNLPAQVKTVATNLVHRSGDEEVLARANEILPAPKDKANKTLPSNPYAIVNRLGDPEKGRLVFNDTRGAKCSSCHSLDGKMELAGPTLSAIASKYDKRGLLDSILNPSAGIAPEYYVYILDTTSQGLVVGVVAEDTEEQVIVRNEFGDEIRLKPEDIVERRKSDLSMMPEDIVNTMTEEELINLLEFLTTLKADGDVTD